jgi:DNA-binding NtrC family response regulator
MPALRERPGDINTLFRKFASDFSAKYGVCKVALTEDASIMLRKYRWPGNIRQLKNVAESVSALESVKISGYSDKCEIGVDVLSWYIPRDEENLLPAVSSSYHDSPEAATEREAVIRMLLQLKQDVDYLKDLVAKAGLSTGTLPSVAITAPEPQRQEVLLDDEDPEEQEFQERIVEDMSIRTASQELIEKVLKKHGGNRKAAAAELGISERTLYRKIKQMTDK